MFEGNSQLTAIGKYAFNNCSRLTSIIIPESVTNIENSAFYGCSSLQTVTFECNSQLTSIGQYAFEDCSSLTSITIPESVTSIGSSAFKYCSKLHTVFYGGTVEQWNEISIGSYNTSLINATRYYYSAQEPALNADGSNYDGNFWHWDDHGNPSIWKKEESLQ